MVSERPRLRDADIIEWDVGPPLRASIAIPLRLTVPNQVQIHCGTFVNRGLAFSISLLTCILKSESRCRLCLLRFCSILQIFVLPCRVYGLHESRSSSVCESPILAGSGGNEYLYPGIFQRVLGLRGHVTYRILLTGSLNSSKHNALARERRRPDTYFFLFPVRINARILL